MKKSFAAVLCFILLVLTIFSGCGSGEKEMKATELTGGTGSSVQTAEDDGSIVTPAGTFPIVKEGNDITLSIFTCTRPGCDDYINNSFTKIVEETMGIKLKFEVAEEAESRTKLNLMLTSGEYPDIISGWLKPGNFTLVEQSTYAREGILIPLNDMIEKYGFGIKKAFELFPVVKDRFTLEDGKIYTFPDISETYHLQFPHKMWIYQPWLDKLGLQVPTTTDEYYEVLKAFKTQDPNGNNKADEIPLTGSTNGWNAQPTRFLVNAFVYNDIPNANLYVKDGKVTLGIIEPEYKEALKYMRKLVAEGLWATESFTQKEDQLKLQTINGLVGSTAGAWYGVFSDVSNVKDGDWLNWTSMTPLKGPKGVQYAYHSAYSVGNPKAFITDQCEYPEVAFRFLDAFYINDGSNPISLYQYYEGEKGVAWRDALPGETGANGSPAKYARLSNESDKKNTTWDQLQPYLYPAELTNSWAMQQESERLELMLYQATEKLEPYKPDLSMILPPLLPTEEESVEVAELSAAIFGYVGEIVTRMIVTDVDIDREWEKYVNEMEKLKVKRLLELRQIQYDRRVKK